MVQKLPKVWNPNLRIITLISILLCISLSIFKHYTVMEKRKADETSELREIGDHLLQLRLLKETKEGRVKKDANALSFAKTYPPNFTFPSFLPYGTFKELPIIVESVPNSCNLLHSPKGCEMISERSENAPDSWIQLVLAMNLQQCHSRPCETMDIGSNLGLLTYRMLQAGAYVTAIEPQTDLCQATRETIAYNGYSAQSMVLCGALGIDSAPNSTFTLSGSLYRYHGMTDIAKRFADWNLPLDVPVYNLNSLLRFRSRPVHYDFIKVDTDSIDCSILRYLIDAQRKDLIRFQTITMEVSCCPMGNAKALDQFAQLMADLQEDGYSLYRPGVQYQEFIPEHTDSKVDTVIGVPFFKFKEKTYEQWRAPGLVDGDWKRKYHLYVTKEEFSSPLALL